MFGPCEEGPGPDLTIKPTDETYQAFQFAYGHFNWILFDAALPNCLITLQRKGRSFGYFAPKRLARADRRTCDEIALNPVHFRSRTAHQTLSTLVHEMVHLWQHHFATPGRGRYHNRQWAEKMKTLGLQPTTTGAPGGQEIGDRVTHMIVENGPFEKAANDLIASGFEIVWTEAPRAATIRPRRPQPQPMPGRVDGNDGDRPGALNGAGDPLEGRRPALAAEADSGEPISCSGVRVKYQCPVCKRSVWSSSGPFAQCVEHQLALVPVG